MRTPLAIVFLIVWTTSVWADQTVESVQQALKDQGFYYGEVTGEKNADTTAAIRRYQIRNGLQINGELNDETLRSIRNSSASAQSSAKPVPAPEPDTSDLRAPSPQEPDVAERAPVQPYAPPPEDRQPYRPPIAPGPTGLLAGTPYQDAPISVQRDVIVNAQKSLARRDLYKGEINGAYGPDLEFSLRAYQSRVGLPLTGRLDLETLAALQLLPGPRMPVYGSRPRRVYPEPVVRGEWVRP